MFVQLRRALILSGFVLLVACSAWAQTTTLEGDVKGPDGQPLPKAVVKLVRTDIKGNYSVKTDKKGHWLYTGLPYGRYDVSVEVDGKVMDKVSGVQSKYGESVPVNFDLSKVKQQQAATAQANANGELTAEQQRGMTKEQKAQYEAQLKQRTEAMKKNKALNDAYNGGQDAMKAAAAETDKDKKVADYQTAIDSYNKASELADTDTNKAAVWDALGEAYAGLATTQTGDERTKSYDQAIDAYNKGLAIQPNNAAVYNQMGNIYGAERKIPEATEALTKAAQLDPTMAAKAYYNMGANLVNSGQADKASDFFKKATDADPTYADAWFQYGSSLMMKGSVDPKSGQQIYPPDTGPALQKYLELQPNGPHAQEASAMLQAMGEKVEVKVTNPNATKKKKPPL